MVFDLAEKCARISPVNFFGIEITEKLLTTYEHIAMVEIGMVEFIRQKSSFKNQCSITNNRVELTVKPSILDLEVIKMCDDKSRIMSARATISWIYDSFYDLKSTDHDEMYTRVNHLFATEQNERCVLDRVREIQSISVNLDKVQYFNLFKSDIFTLNTDFCDTTDSLCKVAKTDFAIELFNSALEETAFGVLKDMIYSDRAVRELVRKRPYESMTDFIGQMDQVLLTLDSADYAGMISKFSRLGDNLERDKLKYIGEECSHLKLVTIDEIQELNRVYQGKFGHIFILSVSGMSVEEILAAMRERVENEPGREFKRNVEEVNKIIRVRVPKVLNSFARKF
jgi:2-oxo-4-hydroxy-4-carboxy--5-ureidoimidazoline (OHCU) decarboxylase